MFPKVSVIIPVYGVEKYIEKCAESLFNQTLVEVEFIFVNDATPDKSIEILNLVAKNYPHRTIKIVNLEKNGGLAAARFEGLKEVTGEYTIHIDSDDWCELDMLEQMYNHAVAENADIVVADYFSNFSKNRQTYHSLTVAPKGKDCVKYQLSVIMNGAVWNKLVRSSIYKANTITFQAGINMSEDLILTTQLCYYAEKIAYIPNAFLHYNQTNVNSYSNLMSEKNLQDSVKSVQLIENFLKAQNDYSDFIDAINQRKLMVKFRLTQQSRGELQKRYIKIYPEVDSIIFSAPKIPIYYKIALWLCVNNARGAGNFIYTGVNKCKKIINR